MTLQVKKLKSEFQKLQNKYGDKTLCPIYGAGEIKKPTYMLVFMNPTARNVSAHKSWDGIRAPWLGTRPVWKMLYDVGLVDDKNLLSKIYNFKSIEWTPSFSKKLYSHVKEKSLYITNIAKCTQPDARKIPNQIYKNYLQSFLYEISITNPAKIITFGNQVNSVIFNKKISVSNFLNDEFLNIKIDDQSYRVYPTYYPVGQGARNIETAKIRINQIL